jgi:hypothetical protein
MGEAKRRKLAGTSEPRERQYHNPRIVGGEYDGRSLSSVFEELGPKPGGGWKWREVVGHGADVVFIFEHPEHPGIERIIAATVAMEFYRSTSDANPLDPGEDRYRTLAEAIAAMPSAGSAKPEMSSSVLWPLPGKARQHNEP